MILGLQNSLDYLFIARPNIKTAEELKGVKKWRSVRRPVRHHWRLTWRWTIWGWNPRRDQIVLLGIEVCRNGWARFAQGSVEATSLSLELGQVVREGYRVLLNTTKETCRFSRPDGRSA